MTDATAVLSCPVCREILKGRPVSMESAPKDPCDGLEAGLEGIPDGVSEPKKCPKCGTMYGIDNAKIFMVYEESKTDSVGEKTEKA